MNNQKPVAFTWEKNTIITISDIIHLWWCNMSWNVEHFWPCASQRRPMSYWKLWHKIHIMLWCSPNQIPQLHNHLKKDIRKTAKGRCYLYKGLCHAHYCSGFASYEQTFIRMQMILLWNNNYHMLQLYGRPKLPLPDLGWFLDKQRSVFTLSSS